MIKLIAIDLDGTLLTSDKRIPDEDKEYLSRLIDKGIKVVVSTGRDFFSAREFFDKEDRILYNTLSGNAIFDSFGNELYSNHLSYETVKKLSTYGIDNFIAHVNGYKDGYNTIMLRRPETETLKKYISRYHFPVNFKDELSEDEEYFSVIYVGTLDYVTEIMNKIKNDFSDLKFYIMPATNVDSYMLEIVQSNISKYSALEKIFKTYGISPEEVMAFGDEENDIEMLNSVGHGYIMKNARDSLKSGFDVTEFDNNNHGVVRTIEKWGLI